MLHCSVGKIRRAPIREEDSDTRENVSELVAAVTTLASNVSQPRRAQESKDPASMSYPQRLEQLTNIDS